MNLIYEDTEAIEKIINNIELHKIPIFLSLLNDKLYKLTNNEKILSSDLIDHIKLCLNILYPNTKFNFEIFKNSIFVEIFIHDISNNIKTDKYWTFGPSANEVLRNLLKKLINEMVKKCQII